MKIFVAVVHAIGEDNEGNTSLVAKTREELDTKLLAFFNDPFYADDEDQTSDTWASLDEAADFWQWNVDEHEV